MMKSSSARFGLAVAALATLLSAGLPARSQTVEEVTVVGRRDMQGRPEQLSRAVSYRDLDITTKSGQSVLKARIESAAKDLCRELGEPDRGARDSVVPGCAAVAVKDAMSDMRKAVAQAKPRGPGWSPPGS